MIQSLRIRIDVTIAFLLVSLLGAVAALLLPAAVGGAVDAQLNGHDGAAAVIELGVLLAVVVCSEAGAQALGPWSTAPATAFLRKSLLGHLLALGVRGQTRFASGDLVSRLSSSAPDAGSLAPVLARGLVSLITSVGGVIALGLTDPWLAVAFAVAVPLGILLSKSFVTEIAALIMKYQRLYGSIAARLGDALAGIRTIRVSDTVDLEARRILTDQPELRETGLASWRAQGRVGWRAGLLMPATHVAVLAVAGLGLLDGRITAGQLLASAGYVTLGLGLFSQVGVFMAIGKARANARRLAEVLDEEAMAFGMSDRAPGPGELVLRGVTVHGALDGVDLAVPAGSSVAVVGPSGAGKSVLASIAGRLIDPDAGQVLLDGVDLRELTAGCLRAKVAYAFERPVLVGSTLADAITLGNPSAGREEVVGSARLACADAFVARLPDGYDTALADAPMSGGQVQRLGLARAIAQNTGLLILDDAMSSLDTVTEHQIREALVVGSQDRTRLIIAHRVSTAASTDLVAWLADGKIRAIAPHVTLWADPEYREIFQGE